MDMDLVCQGLVSWKKRQFFHQFSRIIEKKKRPEDFAILAVLGEKHFAIMKKVVFL